MEYNNARRGGRRRPKGSPLLSSLFFPLALTWHELLLRAFDKDVSFFASSVWVVLLFSFSTGFLVFLILDLIPHKVVSRILGGVLMFVYIVILCVERGMKGLFSIYYGVIAAATTAGDAATNFAQTTVSTVVNLLPFILLSLIPLVLFIIFRRTVLRDGGQTWLPRTMAGFFAAMFFLFGYMFANLGDSKAIYTYDFSTNNGIPEFGVATSVRLELRYAIFGMPEFNMGSLPVDDLIGGPDSNDGAEQGGNDSDDGNGGENGGEGGEPVTPSKPVEYDFNRLNIDFNSLIAGTSDKTLIQMHEFFRGLTPSKQNEYTGLFKGKNLILLCAESFDDYAVDPELTPTLYRLTQEEGFVFTHFYQPDWTLSTCGGEFSVTTGVIPNWIGDSDSARVSIGNAMPTTLGNIFRAAGYSTPAWHNGSYTFYNRNEYLATYGYDYKGCGGGGLTLPTDTWLASDKEMIEATADEYINAYVETGTPFHAYYMTISGHGPWSFSNMWAAKYRDLVEAKYPGLSDPCLAYLSANIELDRALEVLVKKLEDAGIADDTLIVMAADHYPYYLNTGNSQLGDSTDYYNELNRYFGRSEDSEKVTSRYRNTLLMWSASIPRTVVDTPCYSCDIVPTVLNLFGMEYDSRLYTGRDIFDPNYEVDQYSSSMPLVIFANNHGQGNSWITAAGTYEASTGQFTPNEGVTVPDDYVSNVKSLVAHKIQYSKLIVTQNYYSKIFN